MRVLPIKYISDNEETEISVHSSIILNALYLIMHVVEFSHIILSKSLEKDLEIFMLKIKMTELALHAFIN